MTPLEAFRYYVAIKLHFTSPSYDAVKYSFKLRFTDADALEKRNDKYIFAKLAKKYPTPESMKMFLGEAMFQGIDDSRSLGTAEQYYQAHLGWVESASYNFRNDLVKLMDTMGNNPALLDTWLDSVDGQYPRIVKTQLAGEFGHESLILLQLITNFMRRSDKLVQDKLFWPSYSQRIHKYSTLMTEQIDLQKMREIAVSVFTSGK